MRPEWWAKRAHPRDPGVLSPGFAKAFDRLGWLVRLAHRPTIDGSEHLPSSGPFMLVANHSGGIAVSEIASFALLWRKCVGDGRKLAGLGHPFGFGIWPVRFCTKSNRWSAQPHRSPSRQRGAECRAQAA